MTRTGTSTLLPIDQKTFFYAVAAGTVTGLIMTWIYSFGRNPVAYATFPLDEFFQPEAVSELADQIPGETDREFTLSAWEFVGRDIHYEAIGSDMDFYNHSVKCLDCYLPLEVLKKGSANCVGKSSLLASLLLNRLPASSVMMSIGTLATNHIGGHAWVEAEVGGTWYLLESTIAPPSNPWRPVQALGSIYIPSLKFSPVAYQCLDPGLCGVQWQVKVGKCNCGQVIKRLAGKELGWP